MIKIVRKKNTALNNEESNQRKKKTTNEEWSFLGVLNIKKKGEIEKKVL